MRTVAPPGVRFPRFELRDHTGSFYTANGASQVSYRAVKR